MFRQCESVIPRKELKNVLPRRWLIACGMFHENTVRTEILLLELQLCERVLWQKDRIPTKEGKTLSELKYFFLNSSSVTESSDKKKGYPQKTNATRSNRHNNATWIFCYINNRNYIQIMSGHICPHRHIDTKLCRPDVISQTCISQCNPSCIHNGSVHCNFLKPLAKSFIVAPSFHHMLSNPTQWDLGNEVVYSDNSPSSVLLDKLYR